jgi:hypothetical protein
MSRARWALVAALPAFALVADAVWAQDGPSTGDPRRIEVAFTPTDRAQIALWVEQEDGTFMGTVRLTESVAYRGIANRPGANQMNTGFRYPYGRREGVLPVWAHRHHEATGALFRRVFFWGRVSLDDQHSGEGYASIRLDPSGSNTVDEHFCLSFSEEANALDAVTCASVFRSNKGRFVDEQDVTTGYASEPWQDTDDRSTWRAMPRHSLYPPRRDMGPCSNCTDHPDVFQFAEHAREVMPEIDAVTMATPRGGDPYTVRFPVPDDWPDGEYVAWLEVHVEADYNEFFNPDIYGGPAPDPSSGDDYWDYWSHAMGIPGRGQPSVLYRVPFVIEPTGGEWSARTPHGHGDLHGLEGTMKSMAEGRITDDPADAPGSGADRLRMRPDSTRLSVKVHPTDLCAMPDAPELCGAPCSEDATCEPQGLACTPGGVCGDPCDASFAPPPRVEGFEVLPHPDSGRAHHHAVLRFTVPETDRPIVDYHARYQAGRFDVPDEPDEEWFTRALQLPIKDTEIEPSGLVLPTPPAGSGVEVEIGDLYTQSRHIVGIRAEDACGRRGPISTAEVITTDIDFETVSPCFVASAVHGSPMAEEVRVLRRLRDRHLGNHGLGRGLVDAYYDLGPHAARWLERHPWLQPLARVSLLPAVTVAHLLSD